MMIYNNNFNIASASTRIQRPSGPRTSSSSASAIQIKRSSGVNGNTRWRPSRKRAGGPRSGSAAVRVLRAPRGSSLGKNKRILVGLNKGKLIMQRDEKRGGRSRENGLGPRRIRTAMSSSS